MQNEEVPLPTVTMPGKDYADLMRIKREFVHLNDKVNILEEEIKRIPDNALIDKNNILSLFLVVMSDYEDELEELLK